MLSAGQDGNSKGRQTEGREGGLRPVHLLFPLTAITMLTLIFTRIGSLATEGTEDVQGAGGQGPDVY